MKSQYEWCVLSILVNPNTPMYVCAQDNSTILK